jgi:MFS family permease
MLLGVLKLFDAAESRARTADAFAAGAAFGVASTMRTEAFVYAAAAALVIGVWKWRELRTRTRIRIQQVVAFGVAMFVIFVLNAGFERLVLGESLRGGRTSDVAGSIATDVSQRVENTWKMTFDSGFDRGWSYRVLGIMVALGLAVAAYGVWRAWPRRRVTMALAIAIGGSLVIAVDPVAIGGMFVAFPLAAAGIGVLGATTQTRVAAAIALVGLVGVALTSYEQFDPLWGGRYSLPTPMLFGVIAIAVLDARDRRFVAIVFGVGVLMTGSSLIAHFDRQSSREAAYAHVTDLPDEVLIARNEALLRHASGYYEKDSRWLGAASPAEIEEGARIAARAGSDDFYLLGVGTWPPPEVEGWTAGAVDRWAGGEDGYFIQVVRYRRTS